MYDDILLEAEDKMDKAVGHVIHEFNGIRTGRATTALVDGIRVDYYGSPTPVKQLASISIPEPRLIVIKPFDPSCIKEVEKAVQTSDLGVTPQSDGKLIRLNLPPLSEEQRKKLAGRCKDLAEDARVAIRNIRRDANKHADSAKSDGDLTEDDNKRLHDDIQELTKKFESKVDEALKAKTTEIMEI